MKICVKLEGGSENEVDNDGGSGDDNANDGGGEDGGGVDDGLMAVATMEIMTIMPVLWG
jgi:hypothetical protein